ncbi:Alpha/Beta hydrolase protein [Rhypophila decipiens]|uniref:Alpha/Beta hydrolase protein n=1 Tax=Rhypophila decipiens TaxID=261697 RepID=A0AAN6YAY8_9PEZI|nr:Alpha/Beta hydrolase protein [Rhypophila decipiens]
MVAGGSKFADLVDDKDYWVIDLLLGVPLDRRVKGGEDITIHASIIYGKKTKHDRPPTIRQPCDAWFHYANHAHNKPFLVYLCGGPGDENTYTKTPAVNKFAIERGYQVLHLDYRGTGRIPLNTSKYSRPAEMAEYLSLFTQDKIAQDLESVRMWLSTLLAIHDLKFTLLAQSFGGWIAMTYLSYFPTSIQEILLTAAMPPFTKTPQQVYQSLCKRVINRNEKYYELYPTDAALVRKVVMQLFNRAYKQENKGEALEDGRRLGYDTLLSLGRLFGGSGRGSFDKVHNFVVKLSKDLVAAGTTGPIPADTLAQFASKDLESFRLHQRPLYGLLHEAIYCHSPGIQSNWAAYNAAVEVSGDPNLPNTGPCPQSFTWLASSPTKLCAGFMKRCYGPKSEYDPTMYFSGEMIHPSMLEDHKLTANILSKKDDWEHLYDRERIRANPYNVPVRSIVYKGDMYVDWEISLDMGMQIGGPCEVYLVSPRGEWTHGAVKQPGKTEKVLGLLFDGVMW